MKYTVQKLANLAGISVRTLHYYDEINLLNPSLIGENGYRYYSEKELVRLQQILFFRELEFPLEKIKEIMNNKNYDSKKALLDQKKLLELKKKKIEKLIKTIEKIEGGENMNDNNKFSAFSDETYKKYKSEVEEKWGNTDAYSESIKMLSKMSKKQLEKIKKEADDIYSSIAELFKADVLFDNSDVQKHIDRFYKHLSNFYTPSYKMFRNLGQMYVDDERMTLFYEKYAKGMAVFMRDAMKFYADKNEK